MNCCSMCEAEMEAIREMTIDSAAKAIEARRAATTKIGAVEDESAVGNADLPK